MAYFPPDESQLVEFALNASGTWGSIAGHTNLSHVVVGRVMGRGKNGDYSQVFVNPCRNVDVPIRLQRS